MNTNPRNRFNRSGAVVSGEENIQLQNGINDMMINLMQQLNDIDNTSTPQTPPSTDVPSERLPSELGIFVLFYNLASKLPVYNIYKFLSQPSSKHSMMYIIIYALNFFSLLIYNQDIMIFTHLSNCLLCGSLIHEQFFELFPNLSTYEKYSKIIGLLMAFVSLIFYIRVLINEKSFGEIIFLIIFSYHICNIVIIFYKHIKRWIIKYYQDYTINVRNVQKVEQEDKTCTICHEEMDIGTRYQCQHTFHIHCLNEYVKKGGKNCPICRKDY